VIDLESGVALVLAVVLLAYLVAALLMPERFG
jgi:K+-transporting ATPase KdpF subunit